MPERLYYELTLRLADINELFRAPEPEPLAGRVSDESGIERLVRELNTKGLPRPVRTTIELPAQQASGDLKQAVQTALRRYSEARINKIAGDLLYLRGHGIKALQIGTIFLAACLLLSAGAARLQALPEFLRRFLTEGFIIAGWVSMWHPIELLLYSWWPKWWERKVYEKIRDMELTITPAAGGQAREKAASA